MNTARQKSGIVAGILLPIGLICLFAFCSLALALMGGQAYRQINQSIDDSYGSTVAASYLRTKLAQNNRQGAVSLREIDGVQVLVIATGTQQQPYETRIFVYEGTLREVFVSASQPMNFTAGVEIARVRECRFSLAPDGLFQAEIVSPMGVYTRTAFALAGEGGP